MHFMTDFNAIDASLRAVDEMLAATTSDIGFSLGSVPELGEALARAKAEGAFLPASDFVLVSKAIATAAAVAAFFKQPEDGEESRFPHLIRNASELNPLGHLQREIERIIDQYGNVRDTASPELAAIRRELSKISGTANSILRRVMALSLIHISEPTRPY